MNKNWFLFFVLLFVWSWIAFPQKTNKVPPKDTFTVVLDAGHGGHDPGNLGNGFLEKNIALNIVLKAGEILEKDPTIKVIYTRKSDVFVGLHRRGAIANRANADLFVSVHCDAHSSEAHGAGTFVLGLHANRQNFEVAKKENSVIYLEEDYEKRYANYDINSPESVIGLTIMQEEFLDQSILLGKKLQDNFTKHLKRKDRKVKQAGFIVLHQTFMPSVLVEAGFLTNKSEGTYLNSEKGQRDMANAIANAILAYRDDVRDGVEPGDLTLEVENTEKVAENTPMTPTQKHTHSHETTQVPQESVSTPSPLPQPNVATFKVQFLASGKNLPLTRANFRGLGTLSKEPYKNLYRYMYGNTSSIQEAKRLKAQAVAKGYTTAYIVAYKNGKRIPVWQALQ